MKNIKKVFSVAEVTGLGVGDYVMIKGKRAMRRNILEKGTEYIVNNHDKTFTKIVLEDYFLSEGQIMPFHSFEITIDLNKKHLEERV